MSDRIDELGDDTTVALVTFTDPEHLATYERDHRLGFAVLRDPDRSGYRAFGFGRAPIARVWSRPVLRRYRELIRAGRWRDLRVPVEDTRQLGGDVVIDADGIVRWIHRSTGPDDRPSVDEIVAAVTRARSPLA